MTGRELCEWLTANDALDMQIVLHTGETESQLADEAPLDADMHLWVRTNEGRFVNGTPAPPREVVIDCPL